MSRTKCKIQRFLSSNFVDLYQAARILHCHSESLRLKVAQGKISACQKYPLIFKKNYIKNLHIVFGKIGRPRISKEIIEQIHKMKRDGEKISFIRDKLKISQPTILRYSKNKK